MARFAVVQFPGTNCERETARALRDLLGQQTDVVWHADARPLTAYDCVVLPGGFAHGDHLRAGAIARFSPAMAAVEAFAAAGGLVLGICNGFQVLLEAGLLPGAMLRNAGMRFQSAWVRCRVERTDTPFTSAYRPGQVVHLPIAHGEGNYVTRGPAERDALEAERQVALRYCDAAGRVSADANPNGSLHHVAGVVNARANVFGLMPHPERACEAVLGGTDGLGIFQSIVEHVERGADVHPPASRDLAGAAR